MMSTFASNISINTKELNAEANRIESIFSRTLSIMLCPFDCLQVASSSYSPLALFSYYYVVVVVVAISNVHVALENCTKLPKSGNTIERRVIMIENQFKCSMQTYTHV